MTLQVFKYANWTTLDVGTTCMRTTTAEVHARFAETLSHARPKELAHDYLEQGTQPSNTHTPGRELHRTPELRRD
jgi:hypothetical protein